MAGTDATAVLIIVPIQNIVAAVLDRPVAAVDLEHALRVGLFRGSSGDAIGDLEGSLAGLLLRTVPFNDVGLAQVRKVEVAIEFRGGPDLPRFGASVVGGRMLHEVRLAPLPEVELQVFQNAELVPFNGEIVMRLSLPNQIVGQLALRQQGIATDILFFGV